MPLIIGDQTANTGMTKAIYDQLRLVLEPDLQELSEDDLSAMRESWRKMAYAIAKGVIEHIAANMEIYGIETQGDVNAAVTGNTGISDPGSHLHSVSLSGEQSNVLFTQSNDGIGHVR